MRTGAPLDDGVVEAARLRRGGDVVVRELPPLHHHHRELLRVRLRVAA